MTVRTTYTAVCQRSQGWWAIRVSEVPGAFSQARRLDQVERMVRDVVSLALEVPPESFDVRIEARLPVEIQDAIKRANDRRREAEVAVAEANLSTEAAADLLVKREGLTMRETGQLLGLSHQRIAQLLSQVRAMPRGTHTRSKAGFVA
ncbi:MAG: transcriptional regulator [Candidatus Dormibacteraeota bacterium]|nr:transcriptional regulator [Candidatus Dormibacteraeota bacterium]